MAAFFEKLSYGRSLLITAPLIVLYTGVMGSISVFCSLFDARGRLQHGCSRIWSRLILATSRVRFRVIGAENLRPDVPYILCVNHQSHMDIPLVLAALPIQFRFAAKKELFGVPFLGWHLRRSGHISVDRENPRAAIRSLEKAAERVRGGTTVVIFPEGGTSPAGDIKPFKGGGFMLASKSGVDIVPVTIRGSRQVLLPKTYHIRAGRVDIVIGEPIGMKGLSNAQMAERVRDEILSAFHRQLEPVP